jgi:hypothetical protein
VLRAGDNWNDFPQIYVHSCIDRFVTYEIDGLTITLTNDIIIEMLLCQEQQHFPWEMFNQGQLVLFT